MKNQNIYYRIPWNNSNYVLEVDKWKTSSKKLAT